ncbi:MAG: tetratricopeptide repeat protein [Planctomycetes bacterium]|nr:tetratricopeptide repeat protein [Planctomycetota bacterium]
MQLVRILGRSLVDCFCRYAAAMVFPGGDYWPDSRDMDGETLALYRRVLKAIEDADLAEAQRLLDRVLQRRPQMTAARLAMAAVLSDQGNTARAREFLDAVLLDGLHDGRVWFLSGQLAERQGQIGRAIECYEAAAQLAGRSACEATERLAAIYLVTEDLPKARTKLQWLVEARPEEFAVRVELASILTLLGDHEGAVCAYQDAILLEPDNWEARTDLAARLEEQERFEEALDEVRQVLDRCPDFADVHLRAARLCVRLSRLDDAAGHVDKALALNPRYLEAIVLKGMLLSEQDQAEAAVATFHRAIAVNEQYVLAYAGLAVALERAGRSQEAAETMELARRIAPSSEQLYTRLSEVGLQAALQQQRDRRAAIEDGAIVDRGRFDALRADAGDPDGEPSDCEGSDEPDHDELMRQQVEMHRQAVEAHPKYADLRYYFGLLLSSLGRTDEAAEQYRAAVQINPHYVEAMGRLALCYWQMNRPGEARQVLERAGQPDGDNLRSHYRFGLVWADQGLWPLTVEKLRQQEPSLSDGKAHASVIAAMQNLGVSADRNRQYLAALHLVDHRDRPVPAASPK